MSAKGSPQRAPRRGIALGGMGQKPVVHKSEIWAGDNEIHSESVRGPYLNGPNQFAVHFTFDIT